MTYFAGLNEQFQDIPEALASFCDDLVKETRYALANTIDFRKLRLHTHGFKGSISYLHTPCFNKRMMLLLDLAKRADEGGVDSFQRVVFVEAFEEMVIAFVPLMATVRASTNGDGRDPPPFFSPGIVYNV